MIWFTSFCEIVYSFDCYKVTAIINCCYKLILSCLSIKRFVSNENREFDALFDVCFKAFTIVGN